MIGTLAGVGLLVAGAYLGLCLLLFLNQRSLLYYPQPRALGEASLEVLDTGEARLHLTVRGAAGGEALLYFGGNGEDVSRSLGSFSAAFPDQALYLLHYRGYGGSSGSPTEEALHADALALFDRVAARHPRITVIGRSLGTGVAVRLASRRPVARLVLITPYDSVEAVAARHFPWVPASLLLLDKFESWRYAPEVRAPTTLVVAEHDEVIPPVHAERLLERFGAGVARSVLIRDQSHNTVERSAAFLPALVGGVR